MSDRSNCQMMIKIGDKYYCDYYEYAFMECRNVNVCHEGLDDDEDDYMTDDELIEYEMEDDDNDDY